MKRIFTLFFLMSSGFVSMAQFAHQNINLLDSFNDPTVQAESVYGIRYQSCWGYVDSLGNEYGIIGSTAGTYIVNVTDPTNLVQHTYIPHRQHDCIWHEFINVRALPLHHQRRRRNTTLTAADCRHVVPP
jgi:hypothetical protein